MPRAGFARARLPNRTEFSGQKEIPDQLTATVELYREIGMPLLRIVREEMGLIVS